MKTIRQLTRKGDPIIRVKLPEIAIRMLESAAKQNKRRSQDQFIKTLAETFKNEIAFAEVSKNLLSDLKAAYGVN